MISAKHKIEILNSLLLYKLVEDRLTRSFFKAIIKEEHLLSRVHFVDGTIHSYDYLIAINTKTAKTCLWIKGKVYKDSKLLRAVSRVLRETDRHIFIAIETKKMKLQMALMRIDYARSIVNHTIFEASMSYIVDSYQMRQLKIEIDKALDERDYEKFMELTERYKKIPLCTFET